MLQYTAPLSKSLQAGNLMVHSFLKREENNIDWKTVDSFGEEWKKFRSFSEVEIQDIGNDYFDIVDETIANKNAVALDVGCGSGRWARYLAPHVKFVEAIDPSVAVLSASVYLSDIPNIRITQASVDNIPFADGSFDLVYSLGVLHHLPDTQQAIEKCKEKIKPGGWFLLYLYYALENRGALYRLLFWISSGFRKTISSLPSQPKKVVCDVIAAVVYWPLAKIAALLSTIKPCQKAASALPLAYYSKTSFHVMRNDSLDRFGAPFEKRFTKNQIEQMLVSSGFSNIRFSTNKPYWHVIAQRLS